MKIANILLVLVTLPMLTVHAQQMTDEWTPVQSASCKLWNGTPASCIIYSSQSDLAHVRVAIRVRFDDGTDEIGVVKEYRTDLPLIDRENNPGKVIFWNEKLR